MDASHCSGRVVAGGDGDGDGGACNRRRRVHKLQGSKPMRSPAGVRMRPNLQFTNNLFIKQMLVPHSATELQNPFDRHRHRCFF